MSTIELRELLFSQAGSDIVVVIVAVIVWLLCFLCLSLRLVEQSPPCVMKEPLLSEAGSDIFVSVLLLFCYCVLRP